MRAGWYVKREGVAMGNHLAPPFAILFMDKIEQNILRTVERQPCLYKRYVDDCLMGWVHGEEQLAGSSWNTAILNTLIYASLGRVLLEERQSPSWIHQSLLVQNIKFNMNYSRNRPIAG